MAHTHSNTHIHRLQKHFSSDPTSNVLRLLYWFYLLCGFYSSSIDIQNIWAIDTSRNTNMETGETSLSLARLTSFARRGEAPLSTSSAERIINMLIWALLVRRAAGKVRPLRRSDRSIWGTWIAISQMLWRNIDITPPWAISVFSLSFLSRNCSHWSR